MIKESELNKLVSFMQIQDGSYTDFEEFIIKPKNKERTKWELWSYAISKSQNDEYLCDLKDFEDLKYMYWTLSYSELEFK